MSRTKSMQSLELLSAIIFWGSVWGIIEATTGHLLKHLDLPMVELVSFLVSMPCLAIAYRITGQRMSSVYIAIVAAAIRCVPLPFMQESGTIFPVVLWILVEGMVMSAFVTLAQLKPLPDGHAYTFKPFWTTVTLTVSVMLTIAF